MMTAKLYNQLDFYPELPNLCIKLLSKHIHPEFPQALQTQHVQSRTHSLPHKILACPSIYTLD